MKRLAAFFCGLCLLTGLLSGCKIEFPDDLALSPVSGQTEAATQAEESPGTSAAPVQTTGTGDAKEPGATTDAKTTTTDTAASHQSNDTAPTTGNTTTRVSAATGGNPAPSTAGDTTTDKKKVLTCTLSIDCLTLLDNMDSLKKEKRALVPEDGILLSERQVIFYEGETVFDLLNRETKKNRIHMAFRSTPALNSHYIEAIHNLYEKDCGELSGWMYDVNGWYPNYGCSRYVLKDGDVVRWRYTCDLGRDLGADISQWE